MDLFESSNTRYNLFLGADCCQKTKAISKWKRKEKYEMD
jgi:hypothetical protein